MVLSYTWFSYSNIGYLQSRTAFAQTLYAFSGIDYELPTNRNMDGHFYSSTRFSWYPSFSFIMLLSMMQIHDHSRYAQKCSNVQAPGCKDQGILHWFSLTLLLYVAGDIHIDTDCERSIFPYWTLITWPFLNLQGKGSVGSGRGRASAMQAKVSEPTTDCFLCWSLLEEIHDIWGISS